MEEITGQSEQLQLLIQQQQQQINQLLIHNQTASAPVAASAPTEEVLTEIKESMAQILRQQSAMQAQLDTIQSSSNGRRSTRSSRNSNRRTEAEQPAANPIEGILQQLLGAGPEQPSRSPPRANGGGPQANGGGPQANGGGPQANGVGRPRRVMILPPGIMLPGLLPGVMPGMGGGFSDLVSMLSMMEAGPQGPAPASVSAIDSQPVQEVTSETLGQFSTPCSVCQEEFQAGDRVRRLGGCGHYFHPGCVDRWLGMHNTCPTCRAPITERSASTSPVRTCCVSPQRGPASNTTSTTPIGQHTTEIGSLTPPPARSVMTLEIPLRFVNQLPSYRSRGCAHCGSEQAALRCSRCRSVWYCNRDCQRRHHRAHRGMCAALCRGPPEASAERQQLECLTEGVDV